MRGRYEKVHPAGSAAKWRRVGRFLPNGQGKERVPASPLVGIKAKPVPAVNGGMEDTGREKGGPCFHNKLLQ